jgi:glycosyltransferase involved in cell wall biosynthesis
MLMLSLVIPVYNEERHLKACLDAIARQTVMPDEVIVVDNNSSDDSARIAAGYPFVTVIHEPVQGLIPARNAGFARATGDILGRIDADARLEPDWVARVKAHFADQSVGGVTGLAYADVLPGTHAVRSRLWPWLYFYNWEALIGGPILWGANMAIRKTDWLAIRSDACLSDELVHEDQDLSLLLNGRGRRIVRDNDLLISTYGQEYHHWPKFYEYAMRAYATRDRHKRLGTLDRPGAIRMHTLKRVTRRILVFLPAVFFVSGSIIRWLPKALKDYASSKAEYAQETD